MFAPAGTYREARSQFKQLLKKHFEKEAFTVLDELIEIYKLTECGEVDETESHLEFSEKWVKELGIKIDFIDV